MEFYGYKRSDGKTGIRNHVVVMPACMCARNAALKIASATGAVFLHNPNGCGQTSSDRELTLKILSGLLCNGNVFGALIVGLGCEQLQKDRYEQRLSQMTDKPIRYLYIQEEGGIRKTVEAGIAVTGELLLQAERQERVPCDLSDLMLALECGGSDPTSGLSSNVVLGEVSDILVDAGATTVLSENAEAIGAENILRNRGKTPGIGQEIYDRIKACERYYLETVGEDVRRSNPSPGNIAQGITTLEEKSLGCIHKAGTRPFSGVCSYGDQIETKGLIFMDTIPYDIASVTAKVAGGCQIVAFTTGMGTPVGNPVAPVIKITGNKDTAIRLEDMIDFDTSGTFEGVPVTEVADELLKMILDVSNGNPVKAELNGADEIVINQLHSYC